MGRQKILLHVCCAPCSPYVFEQLQEEYDVTLYFYNPNIHPKAEYDRRLGELEKWTESAGAALVVDDYEDLQWKMATVGLEDEPERGARCEVCFDVRLSKTAERAARDNYDLFGCVLTVSPHKKSQTVNAIGRMVAEDHDVLFLEKDWKKKDGYKKTTRLARELDFYRQDYCGCNHSLAAKQKQNRKKNTITL